MTPTSEREELEGVLRDNRAEVLALLDGLTQEQARRRLVPSRTTLLGLVKHAAFVERVWFGVTVGGATRAELGLPDTVDDSFTLTASDTVESVRADYLSACTGSDATAAVVSLDDQVVHARRGQVSVRWIYLHMVEELARHAGHGDVLRELIALSDGRTDPTADR